MQSALLVICGNDEFRPVPISSNILLSVITARLSSDESEDVTFYDRDALRVCCGCLVSLTVSKDTEHVSIAHYTVKEYLYSERITNSPDSFFALSRELVWTELLRMVVTTIEKFKFQTTPSTLNSESLDFYFILISGVYVREKDLEKASRSNETLASLIQSLFALRRNREYSSALVYVLKAENQNSDF